jgi:hypothetical protein
MIRKLFYLLIVIATNATAQTPDMMNVKLKYGANIPYVLPSVNGLTFSGVQGVDMMNVNLKSGSPVQYTISYLDAISFPNDQSSDSIFIELKDGSIRSYAVSSISTMSFTDWDKITSNEILPSVKENRYKLDQNFPNPFNSATTIKYYLPIRQKVTVTVSTLTGKVIASLVQEQQSSGMHQFTWDASRVPGGIYFYRLQAGSFIETKKMILVK